MSKPVGAISATYPGQKFSDAQGATGVGRERRRAGSRAVTHSFHQLAKGLDRRVLRSPAEYVAGTGAVRQRDAQCHAGADTRCAYEYAEVRLSMSHCVERRADPQDWSGVGGDQGMQQRTSAVPAGTLR